MFWRRKSEIEALRNRLQGLTLEHEELQKTRQLLHQLSNDLITKNGKLKEQSEKLTQIDQLKTDFVSIASHEFRTPLAVIKECVSAILEDTKIDQEAQDYLVIAKNNIDRLITLTRELVDVSKLESGRMKIHREKQNISTLTFEATQSLKTLIEKREVKIETPPTDDIPPVFCDRTRIIQVLVNLLSNSLKHVTPKKGIIRLTVKKKEEAVEIQVIDNGTGIPKEKLTVIFEKFSHLKTESSTESKGMGLELSICKAIIEQHHGRIWAESELGVGSTFSFTLPIFNPDLQVHDLLEDFLTQATATDAPMTLLTINVLNLGKKEQPTFDKGKLLIGLEDKIKTKLRSGDLLLKYHHGEYIMALSRTDKKGGEIMESRLRETLQKGTHPPLEFETSVVTYPEDGKNQIELIRAAENNLKRY